MMIMMKHYMMPNITENSGNELYALTVTGGAQPEGYSMMPCIHIIYNKSYLLVLEDILNL